MPVETEVAELFFSKTQNFSVHCSCKGLFIVPNGESYGGGEEEREKEEAGGGDRRDSGHGMGDLEALCCWNFRQRTMGSLCLYLKADA